MALGVKGLSILSFALSAGSMILSKIAGDVRKKAEDEELRKEIKKQVSEALEEYEVKETEVTEYSIPEYEEET